MAEQGYGAGDWGSSRWGVGVIPVPTGFPNVIPISPLNGETGIGKGHRIFIRLSDNTGIAIETLIISVGPVNWVVGGVAAPGITMNAVLNDCNGYDIELENELPFETSGIIEVGVTVRDVEDQETFLPYSFSIGVGTRLLKVRNPTRGILEAIFTQPLRQDNTLFALGNWKITPVSEGAIPIVITEIIASAAYPAVVRLRHTGGGSTYTLEALGILGADGYPLEEGYSSVGFDIVFEEEETPEIRLFNSIYGPLGVSQRARKKRSVDDFVANRSIALALDEQFRLRFQQLDETAGRDGRPGKLRA